MRMVRWIAALALVLPGTGVSAQDPALDAYGVAEARVWLDRGEDPLLQRGDRVRIYYRTSHDAYVAIFQIDTDGTARLLHPRGPADDTFTRGGRDYRLLFPQSSYWYVDEYPGKGYFFIVASPEPLDLGALDYLTHERSWDLTRVGRTVYQDPYVAMDDYVARLIPDWETVPYALDFIAYDVGEIHDYPRFLCYDCHGYRSYASWNPYTYACSTYRVVIWDDPYFYPIYRYRATRVVYAAPRRGVAMFEFKERTPGETWAPLVRTRQPPLRRGTEYVEPGAAMPPPREWVAPRRPSSAAAPGPRDGAQAPTARPSPTTGSAPGQLVPRRGGSAAPAQPSTGGSERRSPTAILTPPGGAATRRAAPPVSGREAPATPSRPSTAGERPVLQRRPPTNPPSTGRPSSGVRTSPSSNRPPPAATRPSGGGTRVVAPPRGGSGSSRPSVRPPARPSGSTRPSAAPTRPPPRGSAKPPPRRKPGGGVG